MIRRRYKLQLSLACCYLNSSPPPSQSLRKSDGQLCRQFHVGEIRVWFGDRLSFLAKSVEVERNCLSHVLFHFFMRPASRNTSRELWRVGGKPVFVGLMTIKYFFMTSTLLASGYCSMFPELGRRPAFPGQLPNLG